MTLRFGSGLSVIPNLFRDLVFGELFTREGFPSLAKRGYLRARSPALRGEGRGEIFGKICQIN